MQHWMLFGWQQTLQILYLFLASWMLMGGCFAYYVFFSLYCIRSYWFLFVVVAASLENPLPIYCLPLNNHTTAHLSYCATRDRLVSFYSFTPTSFRKFFPTSSSSSSSQQKSSTSSSPCQNSIGYRESECVAPFT